MSSNQQLGTIKLDPPGPVVAGRRGTWRLIYTVGSRGISVGGGVRIAPPHQPYNSWEVGKVIATCSRPGANCEVKLDNVCPATYHWRQVAIIQVTVWGASLQEGDEIIVTIGERGGYVSGYFLRARAQKIAIPHTQFDVWVDVDGNGSYLLGSQDSEGFVRLEQVPRFDVIGGPADYFSAVVRQPAHPDGPSRIVICARDEYDNRSRSYRGTPTITPKDAAGTALFDDSAEGSVQVRVNDQIAPGQRITVYDAEQELIGTSNPVCPDLAAPYHIYFGDLHVMTGRGQPYESCGSDHPTSYRYARDVAGLDFAVVTMQPGSEEVWQQDLAVDAEFNQPQRFVTFPAVEFYFTTGHKNVYFSAPNPPLLRAQTPEELWQAIGDTECMVIPHHPNCHSESRPRTGWGPYDFTTINPRYERLIEVCQNRGSFEVDDVGGNVYLGGYGSSIQDALAQGYRLGFVGGSDSHVGLAGESRSALAGLDPEEIVIGGFTAVLAPELTREAIWEALQARRCYATMAAHILLSVKLDDHLMGSQLTTDQIGPQRALQIKVASHRQIEQVEIVRNNQVVACFAGEGLNFEEEWIDDKPLDQVERLGDPGTVFYYVRVTQRDRRMAWSSPIWIER